MSSNLKVQKVDAPRPKLWRSCRLSITICVFLSCVQTALLRDNLGIGLVCMAKPIGNLSCDVNDAVVPTLPGLTNKKNCEFDWEPVMRGRILGAFLYGFILTTMVGGYTANVYGAKIPFMCAGIGNTIFHLLCPTAVLVHKELFFVCRLLQGMSAGLLPGPFFQLVGAWTPDEEMSKLLSFAFSGFSFGTVIAYPMSGQLCATNISGFGGWPLIYYVPGSISILFIIYWFQHLHESPGIHPNISDEEYEYLLENVGISDEPAIIPWASIFLSMPFIAYMLCYLTFLWNMLTLQNNMPVFLLTRLGIKSKECGYLFIIPFTLTFIGRIFNGKVYPIVKNYLGISNTLCRKLYYIFGSLIIIASLLSLILVRKISKWHAIVAITSNLALGDFGYSGGFYPTLLNMAPSYSGLLSGISTFVGFLGSCPSTLINTIIIKENTKGEWDLVFWIIIGMSTFTLVIYTIFGSSELQEWSIAAQYEIPPELVMAADVTAPSSIFARSYGVSRTYSLKHPTHMF